MEYPIIPNGITAITNIQKMQSIQNINLKFVAKNTENYNKIAEELHLIYDIEPMNVRMYKATEKLWNKMELKENALYLNSMRENNNPFIDHLWWKRTALALEAGKPDPKYT